MSTANMIRKTQMQPLKIPLGAETESDLTELSWLTNNINILAPKITSIPKPKSTFCVTHSKTTKRKENFDKAPDSPSSISSSSSCSSLSPCPSPCSNCNSSTNTSKTKDHDFKNDKPSITLSCLIFMALEDSDAKSLPVREIYEWIEKNFAYYKNNQNTGWKSSVRHNLSFSKCFMKLDRNESVLYRPRVDAAKLNESSGRKRRAPNSMGTCWKVNEECKPYLVQTLKKSLFWMRNCELFPNLVKVVKSVDMDANNVNHFHQKKLSFDAHDSESGNLMEFVQKQQEKLTISMKNELDDKLDLSTSSSSLSSFLSNDSVCKRLKIDEDKLNLSSDLEIEVASTLVDMKRIASRNQ